MAEEYELPSDSDESDKDYVPEGAGSEPPSEAESEDAVESESENDNDENKKQSRKQKGKRSKTKKGKSTKRRKEMDKEDEAELEQDEDDQTEEKRVLNEEEEKKHADSLWADFMKDTGSHKLAIVQKPKSQSSVNGSKEKSPPVIRQKMEEKVKITKVFEFAGEEVKVEKEVSADSAEARLSLSTVENVTRNSKSSASNEKGGSGTGRGRGVRKGGLGGISSVLGQLGKKSKISTLEKSKLDWDNFKKQENLEEEISTHNKGKDGYLERQDFLQRADLRQFEIEKQLRSNSRRSAR